MAERAPVLLATCRSADGSCYSGLVSFTLSWRRWVVGSSLSALVGLALGACGGGGQSELWGRQGERWDPQGRLPDFSYAGYHQGEDPIPDVPVAASVKDFGAVGDGETDDSQAFIDAIAAVERGAIFIPPGRYVINRPLHIRRSHLVLRGESRDSTVLYFPRTLKRAWRRRGRDGGKHGYSWGGAWIWLNANRKTGDSNGPVWEQGELLSELTADAARGETSVQVADASRIRPGQLVRLVQQESADGSLSDELHGNVEMKNRCSVSRVDHQIVNWVVKVTAVEGNRVDFGRPLRSPAGPKWKARLMEAVPPVEEVGIEHLTLEFALAQYPGHHNEPGRNAISFGSAYNSWVSDVAIVNADNGIFFWYARYCTARDVVIGGRGSHYAINMGGAQDSLTTRFLLENASVHDTSNSNLGNGNVMSWGKGQRINFDHHRSAAHENLYTQIDVGEVSRIWRSSVTHSGHYAGAYETFWNIKPTVTTENFRSLVAMNIINPEVVMSPKATSDWFDLWLEQVKDLEPLDLHAAQLARRLGRAIAEPPQMPVPLPPGVGEGAEGMGPREALGFRKDQQ